MKNQIISLAQALIQRKSISPNDEGCQQLIAERLQAVGFKLEWLPFGDTLNLWATHGEGEPCLAFAGHTDVVGKKIHKTAHLNGYQTRNAKERDKPAKNKPTFDRRSVKVGLSVV